MRKVSCLLDYQTSVLNAKTISTVGLNDVREYMQVVDDDKRVGAQSFIRERLPTHDWNSIFDD